MSENEVWIVKPSRGKPSIHHMSEATRHVHEALDKHSWDHLDKVASYLKKKGYHVRVY